MDPDQQQYLAFEGLVSWTQAVVTQSVRLTAAQARHEMAFADAAERRRTHFAFQKECHFFAIAAKKLLEFKDWTIGFGLCATVDFSEINSFNAKAIYDLRDMREHMIDYFKADGKFPQRWFAEQDGGIADASSVIGTSIGNRLDWIAFGRAASRLQARLALEPIPYPTFRGAKS